MKVVFYIGHHKVGSTALQVFLAQNAAKLLQAGILYPCVEMEGFAQLLARVSQTGDDTRPLPINIREPHSALAYRMIAEVSDRPIPPQFRMLPRVDQMLHAIRQQIRYLQPQVVILCSEAFANFGDVDAGLIPRLRRALPEADLQIYCALRRPDDYLASWHGQRIKVGEAIPPLREVGPQAYADTIHADYTRLILPWVKALPDAQIHLRPYAAIRAAGGSPEDFFACTGIPLPHGLLPAGRQNASLPRAAMEIQRRANMALSPDQAHQLARHMQSVGDQIRPLPDDQIDLFGPGQRAALAQTFEPVHAVLGQVAGQDAFFTDADQIATPRPVPEMEAARHYLAQMRPGDLPGGALSSFIADLQAGF